MIVVSDTSPLTNLAIVGHLELLKDLYCQVLIPTAVAEEVRAGEEKGVHPLILGQAGWIEVRKVKDDSAVSKLLTRLDAGEAEAIVLSLENGVDLLLIDERIGHAIALERGIKTVGLLGTLIAAKRQGHIRDVRPVLDDLITKAGFWIGSTLYDEVRAPKHLLHPSGGAFSP